VTDELQVVGVQDGALLVVSADPSFQERFALEHDGHTASFRLSAKDPRSFLTGMNLLTAETPGAVKSLWHAPEVAGVTLTRNSNPEWMVDDQSPWMLAVEPDLSSVTVTYADPLLGTDLPVLGGTDYELSVYCAAHRASGRLRLAVYDPEGRLLTEESTPLSTRFRGGRSWADYQNAVVRLTAPHDAAFARVHIDYTGQVDDRTSVTGTAFVFFFGGSLVAGPGQPTSWQPPADAVPLLARAAADNDRAAALYEAPLELRVVTGTQEAWVVCLDAPDVPVAKYAAPDIGDAKVSIDDFNGNAVRLTVDGYPGALTLYIDGVLAGTAPAATGKKGAASRRTAIVVPERYCDGNLHVLDVRDSTGTQVLGRSVDLLPGVLTPWSSIQAYTTQPLPFHLAPAASHRYRALRDQIDRFAIASAAGPTGQEIERLAQLTRVHAILETGFEGLRDFQPLSFPEVSEPKVSVVIPVHNKFNVTYHCLAALLLAGNDASFEVVVVDDGSSDETLRIGEIISNVIVCRNETALGFVGACNRGVGEARGEYVVLLNNDTEPTVGWLDELLGAFDRFENVGMGGSKLLYPDGRLQEAGGIVWGSGNPWNVGRGGNPADPRYSYARQCDYLSGAALMLPRKVWDEVGGLSEEFAPAYFEDTDLAFKVRDAGYSTWFVPHSQVYHFEGVSNGTDVTASSGLKRFQEINRPKFKAKWVSAYLANGVQGEQPDLAKDRGVVGRVLFIAHSMPRPDRDAGGYASVQECRLMQSLGFKVTFAPMNTAYLGHYADDLARLGVESVYSPFVLSVRELLEKRGHEFDAVYVTNYGVAQQVLPDVRALAPRAKFLFNNVDLHFLRAMRLAQLTGTPDAWQSAEAVRDQELEVMRQVDLVLSYNEVEQSVILSHNGASSTVALCPWVVETQPREEIPGFEERSGIAFLGGYQHPPNAEAVDFFLEKVLPELRIQLPDLKFNIYGSAMPDRFRALADDVVNPVGYVETVETVYNSNRIFIAPLLTGAGIKGKVLGALAHGIPSILSPVAAESTGVRDGVDCLIARDPAEWVEVIVRLYSDKESWQRMSQSATGFTRENYSFEVGLEKMRRAFDLVGLYGVRS
jgi:GT2 family glycosyltransferase